MNKTTAGTVTLSNNDYSGTTAVTGGTLLFSGSISGSAATVTNAGSTLGGDGTAATGALTSGGAISLADNSIIRLTLGAGATHSSLPRTGGTWVFDSNQAFTFTLIGAAPGTYDNIISGLTGTETGISTIATWLITNPGVTGTFSYDGAGGVDLVLAAVPEPTTTALLGGARGLLGFVRRRKLRR